MTSRSGLKTLTREFTDSSETEFFSWPSSSEPQPQRASFADVKNRTFNRTNSATTNPGSSILSQSGRAARLRAIEAAFQDLQEEPLVKRPSPTEDIPGPAKRRKSGAESNEEDSGSSKLARPPPVSKTPAKIFLSTEQRHILKLVQQGKSVFYTGSAGTGKSVLLREIIQALKLKYSRSQDAVAITASTGIAACNIGGMTIHSFAGIGLGVESPDQLVVKVRKNKKAMGRWQRTKVLIIDESTFSKNMHILS